MNYENFIQAAIKALGMDVSGFLIGLIGGLFSIFYKVNGFSWRMSAAVFFSGGALSGYVMPVVMESLGWSQGMASFVCFVIGYLAPDFFSFLKGFGPTFFKMVGDYIGKKIKSNDTDSK